MTTSQTAIHIEHVSKSYAVGNRRVPALSDVSLTVEQGEYVAIVGPSGCGKSTLLNILAGIDSPDEGTVDVAGTRLNGMSQNQLASWRGRAVGIVFQFFQLMPTLTALENIVLPMDLAGHNRGSRSRAKSLLDRVGLSGYEDNLPSELSGGEQQRIAVARALANSPSVLLADEPTGNLDSTNGQAVTAILESLWKDGTTIVIVTHDLALANRSPRVISMRDGVIISDNRKDDEPVQASAD